MSLLKGIFNSKESIFVQIASYRDSELVPTVKDLLANANHPENLRILIINQYSEGDNIDEIRFIPGVEVIDIPYESSKGVCWARNLANQYYNKEKYMLQIDSHHRFIKGWDTELIKMYKQVKTSNNKVVLSTYPPSYDPSNPQERDQNPWGVRFDKFTNDGIPTFSPVLIEDKYNKPFLSRYITGGFIFSSGQFVIDVPYDPKLYFEGEEITMSVRAYTHGYDIYCPHKIITWHYYIRENSPKHWDDDAEWEIKQTLSINRAKQILGIDGKVCSPCMQKSLGIYYLGNKRTKREYEEFSGFHFEARGVDEYTIQNSLPPNPKVKDFDKKFLATHKWNIKLHRELLENQGGDFDFIAVIFQDENRADIHRFDYSKEVCNLILSDSNEILDLNGRYTGRPYKYWVLWPYKNQWLNKIEGLKI